MARSINFGAAFALSLALTTSSSLAELAVSFDEGAPKDRFTFKNSGECVLESGRIDLDLSRSASGLIFDVTGAGAGVEVFQPLEFVKGENALTDIPRVRDGDNLISLRVQRLAPGQDADLIRFTALRGVARLASRARPKYLA